MKPLRDSSGFTIVEVMVATAILLTGALGTLAMMNTANQRTRTAGDRQAGVSLARDVIESVRGQSYRQVDDATIEARLQSGDLTGNGSSTDWEISRSGTTYDVAVDVCALDDPADGSGPRSAGGFCSDAGAGGTADGNPIDYKRVTVAVSWNNGSGAGRVNQSSLVTSRGGADAPAVDTLSVTSPSITPITSTAVTSASFSLSTSIAPDSVVWTVDGVQKGIASGFGTSYTFQWPLPSLDGAYDVAVQAYDDAGVSGATKSVTVVLNKYSPTAPTGWNAGRNGSVVEAEWIANRERDVTGYRVYRRQAGGGSVLACSTTTETSCIDANPPATGPSLNYWIVALDRNPAGAVREGAASTSINVDLANRAPNAPTNLAIQRDSSNRVVLSWRLPTRPDPDNGDTIAFLRIYRDGTAVGNRYDRTGRGTDTSWIDDDDAGGSHSYRITAVDTHLRESTMVGPVQG